MPDCSFFPVDFRHLKKNERRSALGSCIGIGVGFVVAAAFGFALGIWYYFILISALAVCFALWHFVVLPRLPHQGGAAAVIITVLMFLVQGGLFALIVFRLLTEASSALQLTAILLLLYAMLLSISLHSGETLRALTDIILNTVVLVGLPMIMALNGGHDAAVIGAMAGVCLLIWALYLWAMRDFSRKRARLRVADTVGPHQTRLQSLGHLAGGVSHDFNNILTVILGNLEMARELGPGPEREALMTEVEGAARRATGLIAQLLTFSRQASNSAEPVNAVDLVGDIETMMRRLLPATHQLSVTTFGQVPRIDVDRSRLESVIVNLVVNGRDSMPDGGEIRIVLDSLTLGRKRAADVPTSLPDGCYARIIISDCGTGIPEELRERVLEPYFTTKPPGKGSGLGLSMAQVFAQQSGGAMSIHSVMKKGTDVTLWLPRSVNDSLA